jgi:hypothetical protein
MSETMIDRHLHEDDILARKIADAALEAAAAHVRVKRGRRRRLDTSRLR